ncbi:NAD(+) diphosphatase [Rheinheimera salexigens]|uniref:NAD(+) diphosphatase n=1 Tax=Rheinheimera salexigens TaxID=1628148 RepID=A0A1E7Q1V0_9GAMM|nr:NAD(+) diphosphatase [Rheinheimera salexigens]OEY68175.1 NADH pyrophosphatase [Rheinheimera salexigens]
MIKHSIELAPTKTAYWLVVNKSKIKLTVNGEIPHGSFSQLALTAKAEQVCLLGTLAGQECYLVIDHDQITDDMNFVTPREMLSLGEEAYSLAARATQVALFMQTHRFCGQCGSAMHLVNWELATLCHKCGHRCYPRIAPCVLIAVQREGQILLARSSRHKPGSFSILAGFVESAETLENAAKREVKEEVGVEITNLRYVGSQPWPFPHSLMAGFIADYVSGEIICQPEEIEEAYWYDVDKLPEVPAVETLSGLMIRQVQQMMTSKINK